MKNKHSFYLNIAQAISLASYARRNQVGALLEKDGNIIAFGYNGTPSGFNNNCEISFINERHNISLATKPEVLHAESNAIAKCARSAVSSEGSTLYTTVSPCFDCAKLIIQAGIKEVYYLEDYRDQSGIDLLYQANIKCIKHELENNTASTIPASSYT